MLAVCSMTATVTNFVRCSDDAIACSADLGELPRLTLYCDGAALRANGHGAALSRCVIDTPTSGVGTVAFAASCYAGLSRSMHSQNL